MSLDLEQQLRESLARQSQADLPISTDPWAGFRARERRHRTGRAVRRVTVGFAGVGLLAAVTAGVIPVPAFVPGIQLELPASGSAKLLKDTPTRGSLAGNTAWLNGLRQMIVSSGDDDEGWRETDPDGTTVHFAADVPGGRVALATHTVEKGLLRDRVLSWYSGPPGAAPEAMSVMSNEDPTQVSTLASGTDQETGYLVVVAPPEAKVRTSTGITFGADGRLHYRPWVSGTDGVAVVDLPPSPLAPVLTVEVTVNGKTRHNEVPIYDWASDLPRPDLPLDSVSEALTTARGSSAPDLPTTKEWVRDAMNSAGLDPSSTPFRIPWTGQVSGYPAVLLELRPAEGGRLFYVYREDEKGDEASSSWIPNLRLLVPEKDADTRPLLWRELARSGEERSTTVDVVVTRGTVRAELVRDGEVTAIQPDANGFATVTVPVGEKASVRAYDVDQRLLGETPLMEQQNRGQMPGSDRSTRLVD